jgi:hypothetical protein
MTVVTFDTYTEVDLLGGAKKTTATMIAATKSRSFPLTHSPSL